MLSAMQVTTFPIVTNGDYITAGVRAKNAASEQARLSIQHYAAAIFARATVATRGLGYVAATPE
jgi:hypothetical protein